MSANNSDGNKMAAELEKLRPSERDINSNFKEMAESLKSKQGKDGQYYILGFKTGSKALSAAFNMLYAQIVIPWTESGARHIYDNVLKVAERYEATSGYAHQIASGTALALRLGAVVGKPLADFVSIQKTHYQHRSELYEEVKSAIEGTPADYSKNEVIATAFGRVNARWSRDLMQQIPDLVTLGIQGTMIYGDHKAQMATKPAARRAALEANTPKPETNAAGVTTPVVDSDKEALGKRIKEIKEQYGDHAQEMINLEVEEYKLRKGITVPQNQDPNMFKLGALTPSTYTLLTGASEIAKLAVEDYTDSAVSNKENAWDKIQVLKRFMDQQQPGQNPDRLKVGNTSLKKYIVEIFQQNEVDRGRGRMSEAQVEQLMPAVDKIADAMADTTLDANALVHLVGDHKIIIHQGGTRIFAKEENVDEALKQVMGVNTSKEVIDKQAFFSNFADPAVAQEVIKRNVASLEGKAKALFVAIFPDELLTQAGMTKEAINHERKMAHEFIYDVVLADTIDLAKQSPEELRGLGLSKSEIDAVNELARDVERGQVDAVKVAVDGADRTVVSAIRTAALHKQIDDKSETAERVWTDMVRKGSSFKEKLENGEMHKRSHGSFAERERDRNPEPHHHKQSEHESDMREMSAQERETHRRSKHGAEPHEGIGAV